MEGAHITFEESIDLALNSFGLSEKTLLYSLLLKPSLAFSDPINLRIPICLGPGQQIGVVPANVGPLGLY